MTRPRCILPGATYLITRRTLRRHHLLRPDGATNNLFIYALAVCAQRYNVRVHAVCVMSTHYHLVATDVRGELPLFLAQFHRIVALTLKVMLAWEGPVWDHEPTSVVRLETLDAIVDKIAYCVANPVAAGLVYSASHWPGLSARATPNASPQQQGHRPSDFFDPENPEWPPSAQLFLSVPPAVPPDTSPDFEMNVSIAIQEHEREARARMREQGRNFPNVKRVTRTSPYARATTFEPLRGLNPTFASGATRDAYALAARTLKHFQSAYRTALDAWRRGLRAVVFPAGTWWMCRGHAAQVAATK